VAGNQLLLCVHVYVDIPLFEGYNITDVRHVKQLNVSHCSEFDFHTDGVTGVFVCYSGEKEKFFHVLRNLIAVDMTKDEGISLQLKEVETVFEAFDSEGTGKFAVKHLKAALRALGFEPKKDELQQLVKDLKTTSSENSGFVTFEQFSKLVTSKIECNESKEEVKRAFRLFDEDNTGKITFAKLKKIAKELGEDISDEDLKEMIEEADKDGDGAVSQEEFFQIMKKAGLY
ncbi:hypothetical protein QYM36_010501, partial [Artemia franciscana]